MNIIKGTNSWRLLSLILFFIIFLGLYYFFILYPKHTERNRVQIGEEILSSFFWLDLAEDSEIHSLILKRGLELSPLNDEIYIKDLKVLNLFYSWNNRHTEMNYILNKYSDYPSFDKDAIRGLCLKLMFVQQYNQKIQQQNYSSPRLVALKNINQIYLETITPWLGDMKAFDEFYKAKHMIPNCKI
ncbi:hypothetical protein RMB13_07950 [Acinetobacter sp. V102_4]|uniref:hypothetical protein n=1 Tax=Acinetobacter sp. V102_4 TaxID=3072984 RepID=UPI00287EE298|nr:hypothetical protein [Acinetobacter sp. V102_4]MDS7929410.1 hypothetical protein [Acinetobacter sp. V102_4]